MLNMNKLSFEELQQLSIYLDSIGKTEKAQSVSDYLATEIEKAGDKLITYSKEEVKKIILALIVYSNANNSQGLKNIKGQTYDDKINTVISAASNSSGVNEMFNKL